MAAGVGADVAQAPVGAWPLRIVSLQRGAVVLALIAELVPERREPLGVLHQAVPVVVANLVPHVAKQRAIGLQQLGAAKLTRGVVRFLGIQRDHTVFMTRDDGRAVR
ncbi:hypothetical protein FQZ97_1073590 [compost metagenome]